MMQSGSKLREKQAQRDWLHGITSDIYVRVYI
jgi:hypothetical protein